MNSKKRTYTPGEPPSQAGRVPAYDGLYILEINQTYDGQDPKRLIQAMFDFYEARRASDPAGQEEAVLVLENLVQRQLLLAKHHKERAVQLEGASFFTQGKYDSLVEEKTTAVDAAAQQARSAARDERRTVALETLVLEQMVANARAKGEQPITVTNVTYGSVHNTPGADEECGC